MRESVTYRDFDWWLVLIVLAICTMGVLEIYSSTRSAPPGSQLVGMHVRQMYWVGIGLLAMFAISRLDYHVVLDHAPLLYIVGLLGLVAVLLFGVTRYGSKSWLSIGGQTIQVAELVKLVIIIVLARYFSEVRTDRLSLLDLAKAGFLVSVPVGLIMLQPDFGTAMMTLPIVLVGAYLAGIQWRHAVAVLVICALLAPVGWFLLKPYQQDRIRVFFNPEENPQGSGYQTLQAKIAVGSGGFWGKGIGQGSQNQGGFIPVRWSDFILAALAEEMGFLGVTFVLLLYLALLWRLINNAQRSKDRAGMFLVMGVATVLGFHAFMNVAMMIGYMPVTGIPLPLMSYGGSATLLAFLALGLVMNVRMRRFVN